MTHPADTSTGSTKASPNSAPAAASAAPAGGKSLFAAWWQAARPPFLIVTLVPFALAYVAARRDVGEVSLGLFGGILCIGFALHTVANLANDLFDHLQGVDGGENIGGSRVLQQGLITPAALGWAIVGLLVSGAVLSFFGVRATGLPLLWGVYAFGAFSALFYVAPPIRYGFRACGEFMVFCNMGLCMVVGAYYALTGMAPAYMFALAAPIGLMVAGVLYFQSLPELDTDKAVGKHTLGNVLGPKWSARVFYLWWPTVWALLAGLYMTGLCGTLVWVGIALSVPLHITACRRLANIGDDRLALDAHGHLVRKMYLINGAALVAAVAFSSF